MNTKKQSRSSTQMNLIIDRIIFIFQDLTLL